VPAKTRSFLLLSLFGSVALAAACSGTTETTPPATTPPNETPAEVDSGTPDTAAPIDSGADTNPPITGQCASTFGNGLTAAFGRIDGVVYAVQKPSDTGCVMPNSDHLIVQVLMKGAVYRMVVNIESDRPGQDPKVRYGAVPHALPAPAFSDGWHPGLALDYATTLDAHNAAFTPYALADLVTKVAADLVIGAPVSVYATSGSGRPESAHLVHRNKNQQDGAIVVNPTSATPKFLLFHFDQQVF